MIINWRRRWWTAGEVSQAYVRRIGHPRRGNGSLSHVFGKQGVHIDSDTVAEVMADGPYFIEPGDEEVAVAGR